MKRILVIATRQIGDVLLTTPVVRAAKQRWPQLIDSTSPPVCVTTTSTRIAR